MNWSIIELLMDLVRCRHGAFAEYLTACSEAQLSSYVSHRVAVVYRIEVHKMRKILYETI